MNPTNRLDLKSSNVGYGDPIWRTYVLDKELRVLVLEPFSKEMTHVLGVMANQNEAVSPFFTGHLKSYFVVMYWNGYSIK